VIAAVLVVGAGIGVATLHTSHPTSHPTTKGACGVVATAPTYKHVVVIVEENHSYGSIIGSGSAPYVNSLASSCGLATNYHNVTHFSLPNYLAMTSGMSLSSLAPFYNDCLPASCVTSAPSIFTQTVAKSYQESMPSNCDTSVAGSSYSPKHNPDVYYSDANCATRDVPFSAGSSGLIADFQTEATAPSFAFVTPNLCNDTHDCSVSTGDGWLQANLAALLATPVYRSGDTAVFLVWDEGEPGSAGTDCANNTSDPSCHVALLVIAPSVNPGTQLGTLFNHYSLLRTVEQLLGLSYLGQAQSATSMVQAFNL
jgi:hypothetical protein